MGIDVYLNSDVTYDSYLEPEVDPFAQQVIAGTAITSINGITGPNVTFSGGTTGLSFTPAGTSITLAGTLVAANGGTGQSSYTKGDLLVATGATALNKRAVGTNGQVLTADSTTADGVKWATPTTGTVTATGTLTANQLIIGNGGTDEKVLGTLGTTTTVLHGNAAGAPTFAAVSLTADVSGTLPVANGGTNIASYAVGDLLYASGSTTLSKLADVATGNALISGGVTTAPSWGKIGLTTHVSGTLPVANGGTGVTTSTGTTNTVLSDSPTLTTQVTVTASSSSTTFSAGPYPIILQNTSNTTNNWVGIKFTDAGGTQAADFSARIIDQTNHYGTVVLGTRQTDGYLARLTVATGIQVGAPTGGDKGAGTANFAADIYKNNTAYTNPHGGFEMAYTGKLERYAQRMKMMGIKDYKPLTLEKLEEYTRENFHFPYLGDDEGNGLFGGGERLLLITEELAVHLFTMNRRLKALEKKIGTAQA